jgi:hypothetical protein
MRLASREAAKSSSYAVVVVVVFKRILHRACYPETGS